MGKMNSAGVIGYVLSICAVGALGASMGAVYWRSPIFDLRFIIGNEVNRHIGLFQACNAYGCYNLGWGVDVGVTLLTTRALLLVACLLLVVGMIVGVVALCGKAKISTKGALDIVGGCFVLAGCSAYTIMTIFIDNFSGGNPSVNEFNWCFFLCWGSGALFVLCGIFQALGDGKPTQQGQVYPAGMQQQMVWATNMQQRNAAPIPRAQRQPIVDLEY